MATDDFTDIVTRAVYQARRRPSSTHAMARAGEFVNDGHRVICDSGDPWTFLDREGTFNMTAGDDLYTFADIESGLSVTTGTVRQIRGLIVKDDSNTPLKRVDWTDLETLSGSTQDGD